MQFKQTLLLPLLLSILFTSSRTAAMDDEKGDTAPLSLQETDSETIIASADETESIPDLRWLIHEAVEHNPEIIAAQKRLNAIRAKIPQATSLDDPSVSIGSFDMSNHPLNINGQTEMLQQRYGISQKIPFPGKLRLRGAVASEEAEMAERDMESKIQEIVALTKSTFYELYYMDRVIETTEENRELLHKFARIAETKYSVGKTTQRDALAAQVELSTLANNLIVLKKERESTAARLNTLLNRQTDTPIGKPPPFEEHTFNLTIKELEDLAIKNRPELKRFDHAIKGNEANLKLAKKDYYYTDFEPMVEYMQEDGESDTWASSLTINVPWLWPKNRSKVKEAREGLHAAKSEYRSINNKTLFEVKDLLTKIQATESTINLYKTGVIPQAEQSLKAALIGYEADRIDFLTLIDSQRMLLNVRLLYYRALTDFEQNLANMERAAGVQLTE